VKSRFANLINSFLFELRPARFFGVFPWLLYPIALFEMWRYDFRIYESIAPWLWQPSGFFRLILPHFPTISSVLAVRVVGSLAVLVAISGKWSRSAAAVAFVALLLLDYWHNMFGFIDARIHLVWMIGLMTLVKAPSPQQTAEADLLASLAFRCMELIVVLVYAQSAYAKISNAGLTWAGEGSTLQIAWLRQGLPLGHWLASSVLVAKIFSWLALGLEASFFTYYLVPRKMRGALLLTAFLFHTGTFLTMNISFAHLWVFNLAAAFYLISQSPGTKA
jgi:hypothetical protein